MTLPGTEARAMESARLNLSVVLVEDEPATREKVSAILGRNIRTVYQAEDGAKGHGGSISVVPASGCGTTFEVRLPAEQQTEAAYS